MHADDSDRNDALHLALARLPYQRAPRMLLPRVMAAVSRPWYSRAWLTWPRAWQAASLVLLVILGAGAWRLASGIDLPEEMAHTANAMTTLARVVWRIVVEPVFAYVLALSILATFTAAAAWAALARLSAPSFPEPHP